MFVDDWIKMKNAIRYTIVPKDLGAHLFEVTVTVDQPDPAGQAFVLPAWIPGSYMIREFSRNLVQARAGSNGKKLALKKLDKHTWLAAASAHPVSLRYEVYSWDLSVRAAHLDQTHGFFNGSSVFLRVEGQHDLPHIVDIQRSADPACKSWRVATSLPELKAKRYGFGTYVADNYDALIDHPVEMGDFALATFKAHGVAHDIVITGRVPNLDMERLSADLKKICEAQIAFFEPKSKRAPMDRYVFMTMAIGDGYGGLEHRASTALVCMRSDLPVKGQAAMSDGYLKYLGLCSHEYFHTWNVKRIKPAVFAPYDLRSETHTPLLWLFEGFTSYYDDLMLVRCGLINQPAYLKLIGQTINAVLRGSGRGKQSVAESSFDAWTKYYRQDENAPNAIVSYYAKGSLIGLALDLTIRTETKGKKSLDDVMRALWQRYGRDFYSEKGGNGVTEEGIDALFDEVTGLHLGRLLNRWVRGTEDLPLAKLLEDVAIACADVGKERKAALGARTTREANDTKLANVYEKGAAHRSGLSAGDVLVALDGLRVSATNLDVLLGRYRVGDTVRLLAFRRDELMEFKVKLSADDAPQMALTAQDKPAAALRARKAWLS
jgi:predicted metalloprotease with PDZ domain